MSRDVPCGDIPTMNGQSADMHGWIWPEIWPQPVLAANSAADVLETIRVGYGQSTERN
jgi:hypothetical protein